MKNISDDKLKAYFLGKLPEPEAESLEIECATDPEIFEQAQLAERELTDDYLRGTLSAADNRLYETNYLITETRRENLQFAARLLEIVKQPTPPLVYPPASKASAPPFWQRLFARPRAFGFAFGGLFLLLACGVAAFYLATLNVNRSEVAEVKDPIQSAKPETPAAQSPDSQPPQVLAPENRRPVSPDRNVLNKEAQKDADAPLKNLPESKPVSAPKSVGSVKSAVLMTVKLLPGSLRDEGEQSIIIAPNVKNLHLLLSPAGEPNNYKIYRVTVKTPENDTIYASPNLKSLSFKIEAEKLQNRTYIISLEGKNEQNEFESIADYTLRVRR